METSVQPPKSPERVPSALCEPCGIGDLPPEVLLNIFQFFNVQQLDKTISPVCWLWRDLSQRPCLRLQLAVEGEEPNTAAACELLRSCPNLKALSISKRDDADHLLHHVALYNHELRRLAVKRCKGSSGSPRLSPEILIEILLCCPQLIDLKFRSSLIDSKLFYCEMCERLPQLRRFNVNFSSSFSSEEMMMIMIVLHLGKLEEISVLGFWSVSPDDIVLLGQRLCGTLKVLKIDGELLSDESLDVLGQCRHLHKLCITNGLYITDDGVFHLSRLRNLESLNLMRMKNVSSVGWARLFSESRWTQMKKLSLALCTFVNDETLHHIASAFPKLLKLDVTMCTGISDEGLRSVFQSCTELEILCVWGTQKYVFRSFVLIPLHTRKLKKLVYKSQYLEEEYQIIKDLNFTVPQLKVLKR